MAVTEITPVSMVINTASAALTGTVATTPADGWDINIGGLSGDRVVLEFVADASGDTVVITAGARPPAQRTGLGTLSVTLGANERKKICVEASRFAQADGAIHAYCADAGTTCQAFILPKAG